MYIRKYYVYMITNEKRNVQFQYQRFYTLPDKIIFIYNTIIQTIVS